SPDIIACLNNGAAQWDIRGGTLLSQQDNWVHVLWDQVDTSGFGYVILNPSDCSSCPNPTVVKVPVVKQIGHIEGPTDICATGKQYRYRLPQWPATVFQWSLQTTTGAKLIATDQPNEYIIQTGSAGIITLKVTYKNTLLGCTGSAI